MNFIKVCRTNEVEDGKAVMVSAGGRDFLLARVDGKLYALSPYCTHDGQKIDADEVENGELECPRHGARFRVDTGEATRMPAVYGLARYDVKVENDDAYIDVD